jgi:dTDP-glucose 4,6-dehydratase
MASPLPPDDLDYVLRHTENLWDGLRGRSLFLTGGTAFIGAWLLESLLWAADRLDLDLRVVVLSRDPARFRAGAPHITENRAVQLLQGETAGFEFPTGTFPFIIHAAMEPAFEPGVEHPLGAYASNAEGTRRVLEFARTHGTRRLLLTSSGAVYGKQPADMTHIPEEYAGAPSTMDPGSQYGEAKRASEFMCALYSRVHGFDAVIARLFAFVGPLLPLDSNFAVGNFIRDVLRGGPVRIGGDGTPCRSYLYAADLAVWLWTLLFRGRSAYPYNVGSPHDLTIAELARTIVNVAAPGTSIEIAGRPVPGASPQRYVPGIARAEELGLRPGITLEEGIRRTLAWHRPRASGQ